VTGRAVLVPEVVPGQRRPPGRLRQLEYQSGFSPARGDSSTVTGSDTRSPPGTAPPAGRDCALADSTDTTRTVSGTSAGTVCGVVVGAASSARHRWTDPALPQRRGRDAAESR
jgi:hypothetical protein